MLICLFPFYNAQELSNLHFWKPSMKKEKKEKSITCQEHISAFDYNWCLMRLEKKPICFFAPSANFIIFIF